MRDFLAATLRTLAETAPAALLEAILLEVDGYDPTCLETDPAPAPTAPFVEADEEIPASLVTLDLAEEPCDDPDDNLAKVIIARFADGTVRVEIPAENIVITRRRDVTSHQR